MLRRTAILTAVIAIVSVVSVRAQPPVYPSLPQSPAAPSLVNADQLAAQVTIYRDRFGVPHITGKTDDAVYFGFGYATAEDHLETILANYRRAAGRAAELGGDRFFLSDFHARLFRLRQMAVDREYELDPELRAVLEPFAAGINYFMEQHPDRTPEGAEPVVPADIVGFQRYVTLFEFVLARYGIFGPPKPLPTGTLLGLAPSRSAEKMPTLMATFQSNWNGPLILYEAHLSSQEGLDVYGATFPGLPAMFMGCNRHLAWGFTPNAPDLADTYIFNMRSLDPPMYMCMGGTYRMWSEPAKIGVRMGQGVLRPVPRLLLYAHNGPVVDLARLTARVVRLAGWKDLNGLRQWLLVNRSQSVTQFKRALSALQVPSLDAVCVDSKGNVFYAYCAKGQYKLETVDWRKPVDGNRTENEWRGFMPFTSMPQVANPPDGFVQSANGLPWRAAGEKSSPKPTDYPPYLVEDIPSLRSDRILDLLNNQKPLSIMQIKKLAWDVTVPFAEPAIRMLTAAGQTDWRRYEDPQGQMKNALNMLQKWDRRVAADSSVAVLFDTWWRQYRRMSDASLSDTKLIAKFDKPGPKESETALKALRLAIDILTARFGKLDVKWGDVHRMKAGRIDVPAQGTSDLHTIHQTDPVDERKQTGVTVVGRGDTFKMIVQLGPTVPSVISIMPGGNSTDMKSPHLTDQMNLYSNGQFKRVDLERSTSGIGMAEAWGTTSKLVDSGTGTTLRSTAETPARVEMKMLGAKSIAPPMPRTAKLVGRPVRVLCTPLDAKTRWTLSVVIPLKMRGLLDKDFTPIGLIETVPGRWQPVTAIVTANKSRIDIRGAGDGTVAVYFVVKKTD